MCRSRGGGGWVWAYFGKGWQVWMGHTAQVVMVDMSSGLVWVCVQVKGLVRVSLGMCGQRWTGLDGSD